MSKETIIIVVTIILFLIIFGLIAYFVNKKWTNKVKTVSEKYEKLNQLNKEYQKIFVIVNTHFKFEKTCTTKYQIDKINLFKFFCSNIADDFSYYDKLTENVLLNRKNQKTYQWMVENINSTVTKEKAKEVKVPYKTFVKIENKIFDKAILKPIVDVIIHCYATYTSPHGRNSYRKERYYGISDVKSAIDEINQQREYRQSKQYQRSLMTNSLRYDILKRDGFRCQICGATAADGVKLHVDHIVPIAKGGKTEPSNLRTLCDRCNSGKSDKIESD